MLELKWFFHRSSNLRLRSQNQNICKQRSKKIGTHQAWLGNRRVRVRASCTTFVLQLPGAMNRETRLTQTSLWGHRQFILAMKIPTLWGDSTWSKWCSSKTSLPTITRVFGIGRPNPSSRRIETKAELDAMGSNQETRQRKATHTKFSCRSKAKIYSICRSWRMLIVESSDSTTKNLEAKVSSPTLGTHSLINRAMWRLQLWTWARRSLRIRMIYMIKISPTQRMTSISTNKFTLTIINSWIQLKLPTFMASASLLRWQLLPLRRPSNSSSRKLKSSLRSIQSTWVWHSESTERLARRRSEAGRSCFRKIWAHGTNWNNSTKSRARVKSHRRTKKKATWRWIWQVSNYFFRMRMKRSGLSWIHHEKRAGQCRRETVSWNSAVFRRGEKNNRLFPRIVLRRTQIIFWEAKR